MDEQPGKQKRTRRERFLSEMNQAVPWARLVALIEPFYPEGKRGRPPLGAELMLRVYFLQQWYALADEALEDALYDSRAMRAFVGGELVPDATTLLKFRHLLERHHLTERLFAEVNALLAERGAFLREGTIVDATIIAAAPSTKNKAKARDPEMHQTRKGNTWHFGMKAHVGVDLDSGLVHTVVGTAANVADVAQAHALLHGEETVGFGDAGYQGVEKRPEVVERFANVRWYVAAKAVYLTALFTGLRRNEMKALEWSDVFLDAPQPYLSARPSTTKNRRQANIRLHEQVVIALRVIKPAGSLDGRKVFAGSLLPGMWAFKTDLQRAGIAYVDPQGRKADFHALRYTFATNLSKAGVLPREAMELLRHSDMRLTMKTYTDAGLLLAGEAVTSLPFFTVTPKGQTLVGPVAAIADTHIDTQTLVSGGHKLTRHGTQTPGDLDSETPQNEGERRDLALAGTEEHNGRNGSSGRIRSFFPAGYTERMDVFPSDGKASLELGCQ